MILINKRNDKPTKKNLYNEKNGERPRAQINSMDRRQGYTHTHKKIHFYVFVTFQS